MDAALKTLFWYHVQSRNTQRFKHEMRVDADGAGIDQLGKYHCNYCAILPFKMLYVYGFTHVKRKQ